MIAEEEKLTPEREQEIIRKTRINKSAFAPIYNQYSVKINRYIRSKVGNEDVAQELTSITFEKALTKLSSFKWQGISIGSWLYRIARNTVYDYFRTNKGNKKISLEEGITQEIDHTDYEADLIRDERELELYHLIGDLEEKDQYLIYYKYYEDYKNSDIADILNMSEENVATRLHRIRKKLKNLISEA